MKIINRIIAIVLIASGLFVMFSSSMVGGGLSGLIGLPLFAAGLLLVVLQIIRQHSGNTADKL